MIPSKRQMEYEKIKTDDFVTGAIADILYDQEHTFKGYGKDKEGKQMPDTVAPAVRLAFNVDGYQYPHKTPWMRFSYSEKSNLYKKFILPLVSNAEEYMEFDLDLIKGMKIKMLWIDKGEFQNIETIRPLGERVAYIKPVQKHDELAEVAEIVEADEVPF